MKIKILLLVGSLFTTFCGSNLRTGSILESNEQNILLICYEITNENISSIFTDNVTYQESSCKSRIVMPECDLDQDDYLIDVYRYNEYLCNVNKGIEEPSRYQRCIRVEAIGLEGDELLNYERICQSFRTDAERTNIERTDLPTRM